MKRVSCEYGDWMNNDLRDIGDEEMERRRMVTREVVFYLTRLTNNLSCSRSYASNSRAN